MILVSQWGVCLDQPAASLHRSPSGISLFISPFSPPPVSLSASAHRSLPSLVVSQHCLIDWHKHSHVCFLQLWSLRACACVCVFVCHRTISCMDCKWVSQTLIMTDFLSLVEWKIKLLSPEIARLLRCTLCPQRRSSTSCLVFDTSVCWAHMRWHMGASLSPPSHVVNYWWSLFASGIRSLHPGYQMSRLWDILVLSKYNELSLWWAQHWKT